MRRRRGGKFQGHNQRRGRSNAPRTRMLSMNRVREFKFYTKEILQDSDTDENAIDTIIATIVSKASRISVDEATEFIKRQVKEGIMDDEVEEEVLNLLWKFSRYR